MTIHQSKGLEFPVVFIYKTAETSLSGSLKSGQIQIDKKFGLLAKLPVDDNFLDEYRSAPIISIHNYLESKKNIAELKRLLYVAVTRAKDELYLSATIDDGKSFSKDSFISLLSIGLNDQLNGDRIIINDRLDYLIKNNNEYKNIKKSSEVIIPIVSKIDFEQGVIKEKHFQPKKNIIEIEGLVTQESGEIISASKVSIFNQCPLKYLLTYEYGFSKLNAEKLSYKRQLRSIGKLNSLKIDNENEDDEQIELSDEPEMIMNFNAAVYGKLVHRILEKEISLENIEKYLSNSNEINKDSPTIDNLHLEKLKNDLTNYFNSKTFKQIKYYLDYKNEFEIYVKEDDYFLHGIIDKIIFDDKRVLILDYKTDDITENEIGKRGEYYLMQLKFYLYIASKLFEGFDIFEGNLIFIKYPEHPVRILFDSSKIKMLQEEINSIIKALRQKNVDKNITHCPMCVFSGFTNKCIIN